MTEQTAAIPYSELSPEQKIRAFWAPFCDADPVPAPFIDDMEAAGLARLTRVTKDALQDSFAEERGIVKGGMMWQLTAKGLRAYETTP